MQILTRLAATQSLEFASRVSAASFLRKVLVSLGAPGGAELAEWTGAQPAPSALDLAPLVEDLVSVFSSTQVTKGYNCSVWGRNNHRCSGCTRYRVLMTSQDMSALSTLLAGQFAKGALVSDETTCRSLEVFQKHGDHR